jgi:glucose/arabinose dehydrogenase
VSTKAWADPFLSWPVLGCALLGVVSSGCSQSKTEPAAVATSTASVVTQKVDVIVDGLVGPTQFVQLDGNRLLVAQLNGDENASTGQILEVDLKTGMKTVLLERLDKPTGVVFHEGAIWVMTRDNLLRASWDGTGKPRAVAKLLPPLPNNGRSEGTLTIMADDRIAFETTGAIADDLVVADSGRLWAYDAGDGSSKRLATGLKNAYAHVVLPDGRLIVSEIGDNIENPPVEELNIVEITDGVSLSTPNYGWPQCAGDETCSGVVPPIATFPAKATPAGLALSEDSLTAYVSLLVTGQVVAVSVADGKQREIAHDLDLPLHVLLADDGRLLVGEHGAGRIISIKPD